MGNKRINFYRCSAAAVSHADCLLDGASSMNCEHLPFHKGWSGVSSAKEATKDALKHLSLLSGEFKRGLIKAAKLTFLGHFQDLGHFLMRVKDWLNVPIHSLLYHLFCAVFCIATG